MYGKLSIVVLALVVAIGLARADFQSVVQDAVNIANGIPGNKHAGSANRGKGCVINWSYEGMLVGLEWKYMCICTDSCTGETMTAFTYSKGGSVEHCFSDLMRKLRERN